MINEQLTITKLQNTCLPCTACSERQWVGPWKKKASAESQWRSADAPGVCLACVRIGILTYGMMMPNRHRRWLASAAAAAAALVGGIVTAWGAVIASLADVCLRGVFDRSD